MQVQEEFTSLGQLDGELICGNPTDPDVYNRTQSHVMSYDKPGEIRYYVFDYLRDLNKPYEERYNDLEVICDRLPSEYRFVKHEWVNDYDSLIKYETDVLSQGYEGIILRNPRSHYKQGRATYLENIIYKLKRFQEEEGVIVDFEQRMHNTNVQTVDAQGYSERSSSKAGLVPTNMVGKFIVKYDDWLLEVAPGSFTHSELESIWRDREAYIGKLLKFRFMLYGMKDKPRFSRAVGFRTEDDR
jgi:DNA ligase-1